MKNPYPAVIVALVAVSVVLFALLVSRHADNYQLSSEGLRQGSQQVYQWRLVTTWPKNFPGLGSAPEHFAEMVGKMSNGRLQVRVYGAGEIVPAFGVFDAVSNGSAEMGHGAAYYWKGKMPAAPFFTAIPFGMNALEQNGWFYNGGGLELWRELYAPHNLLPFPGGTTGVQMGGWFNKEINSVADLKGITMRIPGLAGEVFKRAGGTAVNVPGSELFTAMQTGRIDATEWVGPYNDLTFGFQQIAKYYYYPGWHEPSASLEFIINKTAWESLPQDLQEIVRVATRAVNQSMQDEYTAANNAALQELVNKYHVQLRPFPKEVLRTFHQIALQLYDELSAQDPMFAKIYRSYKRYFEGVRNYHKISEQAYYEIRDE